MSENPISFSKTAGGIPVITERIAGCQSTGYMVAVNTGSRDESKEIFGISHLLEHVVFRETKNRTSYQMAKEMEGAGGELNAFTGREMTAFFGVTIKETKDVAKEMVADIVSNPLINKKDVELEKKIVLQELSMVESEPETYIHDLFSRNMWRGHPLCQDEGGDSATVETLGVKELRKYYKERYGIPNMAVFAVGDVDHSDTEAWASAMFDHMSAKKAVKRSPPEKPKSDYTFVKNGSDHCQIAMGFPAYQPNDARKLPAMMLGSVLGSGTSSRFFHGVREQKALVYSIHAATEQHSDAAALVTYMSSTDENVINAMEAVVGEISLLKKEGLAEGELMRTKRLLKGAIVRSMESTERRMYRLGRDYMLNGKYRTLEQRLEEIDAVTDEQVMAAADEVLDPSSLNITVLGRGSKKIKKFDIAELDF